MINIVALKKAIKHGKVSGLGAYSSLSKNKIDILTYFLAKKYIGPSRKELVKLVGKLPLILAQSTGEPIEQYIVKGNTEQKQYEGYNYLNPNELVDSNATHNFNNDTLVVQTTTRNYNTSSIDITNLFKNSANKVVYFRCKKISKSNDEAPISVLLVIGYNDDTPTKYYNIFNGDGTYTDYRIPSDIQNVKIVRARFMANNSANIVENTLTIEEPMLLIADTVVEREYEPYVGGQPSPSPEYPQEIESVGEKTNQLIHQPSKETIYELNGLKFISKPNGDLQIVGTSTSAGQVMLSMKKGSFMPPRASSYDILTKGIYTFSSTKTITKVTLRIRSSSTDVVTLANTNSKSFTLDEDKNDINIYIYFPANVVLDETFRLMLEEGDTAHEWEGFGYKIPVNVSSRQLIDDREVKEFIPAGANWCSLDGVFGAYTTGFETKTKVKYYFKKGVTYTAKVIGDFYNVVAPQIYRTDTAVGLAVLNLENKVTKFTPTESCWGVPRVRAVEAGVPTYCNMMIVEGNYTDATFPEYQPYFNETTNIYLDEPLRSNDNTNFKENKTHRKTIEEFVDYTKNWVYYESTQCWMVPNYFNEIPINAFCTHYKVINVDSTVQMLDGKIGVARVKGNNDKRLYLKDTKNAPTEVTEFKEWLKNLGMKIQYSLETETTEDIELPEILTTIGDNIVTIDTKIQPSEVEFDYYKGEPIATMDLEPFSLEDDIQPLQDIETTAEMIDEALGNEEKNEVE